MAFPLGTSLITPILIIVLGGGVPFSTINLSTINQVIVSASRPPPTKKSRTNWIFGSRGASGIAELFQNAKRIRLALVSASGTPMVTNLSFLLFRALGISKIGFLGEK